METRGYIVYAFINVLQLRCVTFQSKAQPWSLPSEEPAKSISPSASAARDVIFVFPPLILMEATRTKRSLNQTSMTPHLVPVNMKSLLTVMQWMSNPVDSDLTSALVESENTFPAIPSTEEPPEKRKSSQLSISTTQSTVIMVSTVTLLYPSGHKFDIDYYLGTHMPLVSENWMKEGLESWEIIELGPNQKYQIQANLKWKSLEAFGAAAQGPSGKIVLGDIPNFTTAQPEIFKGKATASSSSKI